MAVISIVRAPGGPNLLYVPGAILLAPVWFIAAVNRAHVNSERLQALYKKSDDELAAMGLTRDGLVSHVFGD